MPLPAAIKTQFAKLDLERQLVANATSLVAVGPSFEAEINALYPCTVGRSRSVIAGFPTVTDSPRWPRPMDDGKRRVIMVGRPTGQKGWDYAAAALASLSASESARLELTLIGGLGTGDGPYSQYSRRVAQASMIWTISTTQRGCVASSRDPESHARRRSPVVSERLRATWPRPA